MIATKKTMLSIAVALAVTACGGGGGGGGGAAPAPVTVTTSAGQAVDGYLGASSVLCDANDNGLYDGGENKVLTDAHGAFTFSPACDKTIVVWGGSNSDGTGDFRGLLKAPAGSTIVTPLTSLMVGTGGLTAAQVATALGLPAGTDVSKTDPTSNLDLQKKTVAVQLIIQQLADTLAGLAQNANPAAIQVIYSQVAKAVASTLAANPTTPLVDANGVVSPSLVSSIVKQSVTNAAAENPNLLNFSTDRLAELVSGAISTQAQAVAQAADAPALVVQATSLQANPTLANTATQLADLLIPASTANLASVIQALVQDNITNIIAAAQQSLSIILTNLDQYANYLSIVNDSITFGFGSASPPQTETLTTFQSAAGVILPAKPDTISLTYKLNGKPIPVGGSQVSVGLEITQASTGRVLQVILDQVNLSVATVNNVKTLTATVPAGAQLYAYGKTAGGASANLTLSNDVANQWITSSGSTVTVNATNIVNNLVAKANVQANSPFANLLNVKGTFTMKVLVSNLTIRSATPGAVKSLGVSVNSATAPGTSIKSVSGLGVEGKFTLN